VTRQVLAALRHTLLSQVLRARAYDAPDLTNGDLRRVVGPTLQAPGSWSIITLGDGHAPPAAAELTRFVTTPRATQAMLRGAGVAVGRFKPSIHVTLWS